MLRLCCDHLVPSATSEETFDSMGIDSSNMHAGADPGGSNIGINAWTAGGIAWHSDELIHPPSFVLLLQCHTA